jgi:hypothetical protein
MWLRLNRFLLNTTHKDRRIKGSNKSYGLFIGKGKKRFLSMRPFPKIRKTVISPIIPSGLYHDIPLILQNSMNVRIERKKRVAE